MPCAGKGCGGCPVGGAGVNSVQIIDTTELGSSFGSLKEGMHKPMVRVPASRKGNSVYEQTVGIVRKHSLHTVCEEASCPNIYECWGKKHASFMILGSTCTRRCRFCDIATGKPDPVDPSEPLNIGLAVSAMGLRHVVVTSVDRDDLPDGGAEHFEKVIKSIRGFCPTTTIEVLIPDFLGKEGALEKVIAARPDVINHNMETIERLYPHIRPQGKYRYALNVLSKVKQVNPEIVTKSGLMLGLGEATEEVEQLLDDLRSVDVDMVTIGQYLRPSKKHAKLYKYVTEEEFNHLKVKAYEKGFSMVSSSALTRSSYHADDDFAKLKEKLKRRRVRA